jgi:CheY-like chemotaxis protein
MRVESAPGKGTTFQILFPSAEPVPVPAQRPTTTRHKLSGTVLVVDDEDMVRQIAKATLEIRGFKVLLATNGREAIDMVLQHPEIALVLLDLTMPVMSGDEAIDSILDARPGVKVIVSTGYDSRATAARFNRTQVTSYLQKPYTSRQLAEAVKAALETKGGEATSAH